METAASRIHGMNKPGLELRLVVGEAALHQEVGGPKVMREQLAMLAQAAGNSGAITVQVLPFEAGAHAAAADGSLALLEFAPAGNGESGCAGALSRASRPYPAMRDQRRPDFGVGSRPSFWAWAKTSLSDRG